MSRFKLKLSYSTSEDGSLTGFVEPVGLTERWDIHPKPLVYGLECLIDEVLNDYKISREEYETWKSEIKNPVSFEPINASD